MKRLPIRTTAAVLLALTTLVFPASPVAAEEESSPLHRLTKKWKGGAGLLARTKSEAGVARWQAFAAAGATWGYRARGPLQITLNVLVGTKSEDFDTDYPNPGDGYGLVNYVRDALGEAAFLVKEEGLDEESKLHAARLLRALENTQKHVTNAHKLARDGVKTAQDNEVLDLARRARYQLYYTEAGFDDDKSGEVDPDEWALGRAIEEAARITP